MSFRVEKELWNLANQLRGKGDTSDYGYTRKYLLALIFLKYVNDVWHTANMLYKKQYADDKELIARKMQRERFSLPPDADFNLLVDQIGNPKLGELVNRTFIKIEAANRSKLDGLFRNVDFLEPVNANRHWTVFLADMIRAVSRMELATVGKQYKDDTGDIFAQVLTFWPFSISSRDEYHFGPIALCELLVRLVAPQAGDRIYDPFSNVGTLLSKAAASIRNNSSSPSDDFFLFGQERSLETITLSRMRMLMQELDDAQITVGDPIRNPLLIKGSQQLLKFDVSLSIPPWNVYGWGHEIAVMDPFKRFEWGIPPERKGDLANIQHMIATLSDKGRMGVVVPLGLLFREGRELAIRQGIITDNLLDAVIVLPSNLFFTTSQACAIMIFNKDRSKSKNVLFIDASQEFEPDKRQNKLRPQDIDHIVTTYCDFKSNSTVNSKALQSKYSAVVTPEDIATNNYNLNVPRYIDAGKEDTPLASTDNLKKELEVLENELIEIRKDIGSHLEKLGLA